MHSYDAELQMFMDTPREPNQELLRFHRWLFENDRYQDDAPTNTQRDRTTFVRVWGEYHGCK